MKQVDEIGKELDYKARCVLQGELQKEYVDFNSEELFAPVAYQKPPGFFLNSLQVKTLKPKDVTSIMDVFLEI